MNQIPQSPPPIAPPEPTMDRTLPLINVTDDWAYFRIRFWPLYGVGSIGISLVCLLGFLPLLYFPSHYSKPLIIGAAIVEGISLAFFAALVDCLTYRSGISENGILLRRARKSRVFAWEDIETCRQIRLLFASYLKVKTSGMDHTLWLPLFHKDQGRFEQLIIDLAPSNNPLRQYFAMRSATLR